MLDKAVFGCILCGMLAIYYMSVYVVVSVVIVLLLFLYYRSKVNWWRINVRGLTRLTPFQKFLIFFRTWTDCALISIMKSTHNLRPASQRGTINGAPAYSQGRHLTMMETPEGKNHSGLDGENFEYNRRNSFSANSSSDSVDKITRSYNRGQRVSHQTPSRYSGHASFSPKGLPWGKSVSPKLRSHGAGVKTVQTVAGPLLASTRFNINKNLGLVIITHVILLFLLLTLFPYYTGQ